MDEITRMMTHKTNNPSISESYIIYTCCRVNDISKNPLHSIIDNEALTIKSSSIIMLNIMKNPEMNVIICFIASKLCTSFNTRRHSCNRIYQFQTYLCIYLSFL